MMTLGMGGARPDRRQSPNQLDGRAIIIDISLGVQGVFLNALCTFREHPRSVRERVPAIDQQNATVQHASVQSNRAARTKRKVG